ncbi:MAG: hypothetical protein V4616_04055 [Bacteroidota bacterium]
MKALLFISVLFSGFTAHAQVVSKMEISEPVQGLCNNKEVYALVSSAGNQQSAVSPMKPEDISSKLNSTLLFIKEHPKHTDKGSVNVLINCEGKVVRVTMEQKTSSPDLDQQIIAFFSGMGDWQPGMYNSNKVDSYKVYTFTIRNGKFLLM